MFATLRFFFFFIDAYRDRMILESDCFALALYIL